MAHFALLMNPECVKKRGICEIREAPQYATINGLHITFLIINFRIDGQSQSEGAGQKKLNSIQTKMKRTLVLQSLYRSTMMTYHFNKVSFILIAVLATAIGFYPSIYLFLHGTFGLLSTKSDNLLNDKIWQLAFYTHISLGGIALLIGWTQFITRLRTRKIKIHRTVGKIYVLAVLCSALSGFYIALFATGGLIPSAGFACLATIWFYSTLQAYLFIRRRDIDSHQQMMIYSYAACFAAVTLRLYLPLLQLGFGNFLTAYSIVAWLCWIPNLIVAYFIVRKVRTSVAQSA